MRFLLFAMSFAFFTQRSDFPLYFFQVFQDEVCLACSSSAEWHLLRMATNKLLFQWVKVDCVISLEVSQIEILGCSFFILAYPYHTQDLMSFWWAVKRPFQFIPRKDYYTYRHQKCERKLRDWNITAWKGAGFMYSSNKKLLCIKEVIHLNNKVELGKKWVKKMNEWMCIYTYTHTHIYIYKTDTHTLLILSKLITMCQGFSKTNRLPRFPLCLP